MGEKKLGEIILISTGASDLQAAVGAEHLHFHPLYPGIIQVYRRSNSDLIEKLF